MPEFNLTENEIERLTKRFNLFQKERKIIHNLLNNYVLDYQSYSGSANKRYEYLRKKYLSKAPYLSHLFFQDETLWSMEDISIILGRHLTTIIRTFEKLERSSEYYSRLLALRKTVKATNGHNIFVYKKEIFDIIIDLYEDEYLQRFSEPRRGNIENAPDIQELKRFWEYLRERESYNIYLVEKKKSLPDLPNLSLKNILNLIWQKVFDVKIWTVSSVIFAVCFEIARRFLGINLWLAIIPALISILCIILIHKKKFKPDVLSDLGAGALLFMLLWISASLSVDRLKPEIEKKEHKIALNPVTYNDNKNLYFNISSNFIPKEYFFRISPDNEFHSTGFLTENNLKYPAITIKNPETKGIINLEVKYLGENDKESKIWDFSFDVEAEKFKLNKEFILNSQEAWVEAKRIYHYSKWRFYVTVSIAAIIFSQEGKNIIESFVYGINKETPDITINLIGDKEKYDKYWAYGQLLLDEEDYVEFVSSYLIFKDGTSSDIRISRAE